MERVITPRVFWGARSGNLRARDINKLLPKRCASDDFGIDRVVLQNLESALKKAYTEVHTWRTTAKIDTWTH